MRELYKKQHIIAGICFSVIASCQPQPEPIKQPPPPSSTMATPEERPDLPSTVKDGERPGLEATSVPSKSNTATKQTTAIANANAQNTTTTTRPKPSPSTAPQKLSPWTSGSPARPTVLRSNSQKKNFAASLIALGTAYTPRTHHLAKDGSPEYTNRLILENSPYLLQHAHNPVDWFPWSNEAFELAKRLDRPVLMSVGYATCHWCHVMERESFEDPEIADYMNQHFVCIKVDREERPDVDSVYMDAVHMLAGRGGWPMTIVMTPDKRPFFAGTYFPPRDGARGARRGFLSILTELSENYESNRSQLVQKAASISHRLAKQSQSRPAAGVPGPAALKAAATRFAQIHDPNWGGFGRRPKFPRPVTLDFLLRYYRRTNDSRALTAVTKTLDRMADGGMYDQIGGGFHRYSVDDRWLVPHFEKMLYDNGQLAVTYLDAWQVTANTRYANVATDILDYVAREMVDPSGAFWSATDADSEGVEGKFFVWSKKELDTILGAEVGRIAAAWWGVTDAGNFEHANILHTWKPKVQVAGDLGISIEKLDATVKSARKALYEYRLKRKPPLTDDKVLTAWNGLMISGFARGGFLLNRPDFTQIAKAAASRVLSTLRTSADGRLLRTWRAGGTAKHRGYLEDYAFLIQGLLDVFEATSERRWLSEAISLSNIQLDWYQDDSNGGFFRTARDAEKLLTRQKPNYDGAEPSGNSITARNLLRIHEYTGNDRYLTAAEGTFRWAANRIIRGGPAVPAMLSALDMMLDKSRQVFIVQGTDSDEALRAVIQSTYLPNRTIIIASASTISELIPLVPSLEGKVARQGKTTAYVCEGGICQRPTRDPKVLASQLKEVRPYPVD